MNQQQKKFLPRASILLRLFLFALAVLVVSPQSVLAYSEELELALAHGEYLYQQEDPVAAEPYFELCLTIEPKHGRANQYKALCALADERYPEAEQHLQIALEREEDNPEVLFSLVRVYATWGKYEKGWQVLQSLPQQVRTRPLVRYFEGVIQVGRGQLVAAIEPLEDVSQLDHAQAFRAIFYLGVAYEKTGDTVKARQYYNRVLAEADDSRLIAEANRRVRRIEQKAKSDKKWWSLDAGTGLYYDDNIPLRRARSHFSSDLPPEDEGYLARVYADAFFKVLKHDAGYLGFGGGLRYHALIVGHIDLRDYDLFRTSADMRTRWRLFRSRVAGYAGLRLDYDYTMLDFKSFNHRASAAPHFDLYETKWTATRIKYRITYRNYPEKDQEDRDGLEHEPILQQFIFLTDRDGFIQFTAAGQFQQTDSRYYDYRGFTLGMGLDLRMFWQAYVVATADYVTLDYMDHPLGRLDQRLDLYGGLYVKPIKWLKIMADYQYTHNDSRADYQFERNVIGLSVGFEQ